MSAGSCPVSGSLKEAVRRAFGEGVSVRRSTIVAGGDINRACTLELSDGRSVFMKRNDRRNLGFFQAEAVGLAALRSTGAVRTPEVLGVGTDGSDAFLLLEQIEAGPRSRTSSAELGLALARMHLADAGRFVKDGGFGFPEDNYIGASVQINTPRETWVEFFLRCRLQPQFERALPFFGREERKQIDRFLDRVDRFLNEPERPSLLHGDLWAGNYMIDRKGHPWLIDPAVYVGHAEADLAMTELFGGFDHAFYAAYRSEAAIAPEYKDRRDLYNLYHLLNHLNLFGAGYLSAVRAVLDRYV